MDAIKKGLAFIKSQQQKDGSFLSLSSPKIDNFKEARVLHPTFPTSLILSQLDLPQAREIAQKAVRFLLSQKNPNWTFNYWTKRGQKVPLPRRS